MNDFKRLLSEHALTIQEVLLENTRKQQYTAVVKDASGKTYVAKYRASGASSELEQFDRELTTYREGLMRPFIPEAFVILPSMIVLERVNGVTLREFLMASAHRLKTTPGVFEEVWSRLLAFFESNYSNTSYWLDSTTQIELRRRLHNLACSGPSGTKPKQYEAQCNRLLSKGALALLKRKQVRRNPHAGASLVHGDLHLNNILVEHGTLRVLVIDWESAHNGSALPDLLYCSAMARTLVTGAPQATRILDESVARLLHGASETSVLQRYFSLFTAMVQTNSRFGGSRSLLEWTKSWGRVLALCNQPL